MATSTIQYTKSAIGVLKDKKILSYPTELGSTAVDEVGNPVQYIMIRINTPTSSSTLREDKKTGAVYIPDGNRTGALVHLNTTSSAKQSAYDPLATGQNTDRDEYYASYYSFNQQQNENNKMNSSNENLEYQMQKGMSRLDKVIILPMPNEHQVGTIIGYDNSSSSMLDKALDIAASDGATGDLLKLAGVGLGSTVINTIKSKVLGGKDVTSTDKFLASQNKAINPMKEILFKDIPFRSYTFQFKFAPRNAVESETVQEIIRTLRYYSLPELHSSKLFYTFPAEFEIAFMRGDVYNPSIPKITTSVLQRVNVNYSPAGSGWNTLPDGMPVQTLMTLEFQELELIDRRRVWNKDSVITGGF